VDFAAFVPIHSGGPAADFHRFPYYTGIGTKTKSILTPSKYHPVKKVNPKLLLTRLDRACFKSGQMGNPTA
jgi:hypothetical protein